MILFYIPYSSFAGGRKDRRNCFQKDRSWDFLGSPAVETLCFLSTARGLAWVQSLVGELRFPHAMRCSQEKKKDHSSRGRQIYKTALVTCVVITEPCYIYSQRWSSSTFGSLSFFSSLNFSPSVLGGQGSGPERGLGGRSSSLATSEDSVAPRQHTPSCEGGHVIWEALLRKPDLLIDRASSCASNASCW